MSGVGEFVVWTIGEKEAAAVAAGRPAPFQYCFAAIRAAMAAELDVGIARAIADNPGRRAILLARRNEARLRRDTAAAEAIRLEILNAPNMFYTRVCEMQDWASARAGSPQ